MFNSDKMRHAVAAIGAILLTSVSVGAAVGPARAVETEAVYASAEGPAQIAIQARA